MPGIDIVDETYIAAPAAALVDEVADERRWAGLGLDCECYEDRGEVGRRWRLSGDYLGTAEVWLESVPEGTIVHAFVRAEPTGGGDADRHRLRLRRAWKREVFAIKSRHDHGRPPGITPEP